MYQARVIDDTQFDAEVAKLRVRREALERQIEPRQGQEREPTAEELQKACEQVRAFVRDASGDHLDLLANALQIRAHIEKGRGDLVGVVPATHRGMTISKVCPTYQLTDSSAIRRCRGGKIGSYSACTLIDVMQAAENGPRED